MTLSVEEACAIVDSGKWKTDMEAWEPAVVEARRVARTLRQALAEARQTLSVEEAIAEIEQWRAKLAEQCGQTLAARAERDAVLAKLCVAHAHRVSVGLHRVEAGAQTGSYINPPEGTCRDRQPVEGAVGLSAGLDDGFAGARSDQDIATGGNKMAFTDEISPFYRRRLANRHITEVEAILEAWGYPPDGDIRHLFRSFMAERIGREGENDADRNIVHHPV